MMRRRAVCAVFAACWLAVSGRTGVSEEKPLRRAFSPGAVESYRVEVALRTEVRGVEGETIGAKTYVKPFLHAAEGTLHWTATRRTGRLDAAGIAEMEEAIEQPGGNCPSEVSEEENSRELRNAMEKFCASWRRARVLRYREGSDGFIQDFPKEATPVFGDDGCSVLPYWSRHAWRPSVILPAEALRFGVRRERKSHPNMPRWNPGEGSEMSEWLATSRDAAAVTLHVVQQLSNQEHWVNLRQGAGPGRRQEKNSFFAESLSTLSTLDGSLFDAMRSAACETTWTLDPFEGLPEPPRFSSKLSVTVAIHRLP